MDDTTTQVAIKRKLRGWGQSLGVVIPKYFVDELGLRKNMRVEITVRKIPRKKKEPVIEYFDELETKLEGVNP